MSISVLARIVPVLSTLAACGAPPPDLLEITPPTPIKAHEVGMTTQLTAKAYRGKVAYDDIKQPLVVTWTSSDPAVATVDANGLVTAAGSGKAKIVASVPGAGGKAVTADVDVDNLIVASVEASGDFPAAFRLDSKPVPLKVVVKNEKGLVLDKPKLSFRATDYCVEVTPEGVVHPLAVGSCSVVIECAGKTAKIDLEVQG